MTRPAVDIAHFSDVASTISDRAIDPHLWPTAIEQVAPLSLLRRAS